MSHVSLLLRLRARLLSRCTQWTPYLEVRESTLLPNRALHTTAVSLKVSGEQRKRFAEELQKQLSKDKLQGTGRGKIQFDRELLEDSESSIKPARSEPQLSGLKPQSDEHPSVTMETVHDHDAPQQHVSEQPTEWSREQDTREQDTRDQQDNIPSNVVGDLESLFSVASPPDPVIDEQVCEAHGLLQSFSYS